MRSCKSTFPNSSVISLFMSVITTALGAVLIQTLTGLGDTVRSDHPLNLTVSVRPVSV